jgi:hypothetical protein
MLRDTVVESLAQIQFSTETRERVADVLTRVIEEVAAAAVRRALGEHDQSSGSVVAETAPAARPQHRPVPRRRMGEPRETEEE